MGTKAVNQVFGGGVSQLPPKACVKPLTSVVSRLLVYGWGCPRPSRSAIRKSHLFIKETRPRSTAACFFPGSYISTRHRHGFGLCILGNVRRAFKGACFDLTSFFCTPNYALFPPAARKHLNLFRNAGPHLPVKLSWQPVAYGEEGRAKWEDEGRNLYGIICSSFSCLLVWHPPVSLLPFSVRACSTHVGIRSRAHRE